MNVELREFTAGVTYKDFVKGKSAGDEGTKKVQAGRSHILVDGEWVGHVGWAAGEQVVFCKPVTEEQREAVLAKVREEFEGEVTAIMASPSFENPTDRRKSKRKLIMPGQTEEDEDE